MDLVNTLIIVLVVAVADCHVIRGPIVFNNTDNRPLRVLISNGTRVTLRNVGKENFSINRRRFVPLNTANLAPITEESNEDEPPTVIVESPVNVGGITVQGQNLLAGQQYVARENPSGGITLVPVVNILSSESVVGGASIITDGNLVDGVDRIDGVPVVTANNCCEEETVLRNVCNTLGGGCSVIRQRVCLRKCEPEDVVVVDSK